jgi:subfamily B ATP-binding cassette protein MsbA
MATLLLVYDPFKGLAKTNSAVQQGLASAERIFELLDEPTEIEDRPGAIELPPLADAIRFEQVGFRYPARVGEEGAPAAAAPDGARAGDGFGLRGIDLVLRRGEVLALVGASGGGKSTIADLIPRFWDPTEGRITIDGVDLRDATLVSLRRQVGIVTQFTFLFNDTVGANISYGNPATNRADVEAAARAAHAHDFIAALPRGYDTVVGELGVTLSGGQRQRVAIARALLKNAPILILDEATSALDSESERLVQDAIDRLMEGRTVLVIAHRLATVRRADRIAVVVGGRVVDEGRHDDLYRRGGAYRRLCDQQMSPGAGPVDPAAAEALPS